MKRFVFLLLVVAVIANPAVAAEVAQDAEYSAALRKILKRIRMPEGFRIDLFAIAPRARHMAIDPDSGTVWIGTRKNTVWAATDRDNDHVADTVRELDPDARFDIPNGVCRAPDGVLYVVERNRVMEYPAAVPVVARGDLIPASEESRGHSARVCVVGPDNKLYISLGQPFNVTPPEKIELYKKTGIGGIIRMDRDGKNREVVATGIRNSVGHAFNPKDGKLWFTDNQVDGMGDETPPGELNKMPKMGMWYGHPYTGGGDVRTNEYKGKAIPRDEASRYVKPQVEMIAHAADLGMMFYTGKMFPSKYNGAIFSAQHGSWDAVKPRGARVMVTFLDAKGNATKSMPFAEGWLNENGVYMGRPVDVQQYVDGSILVSDDKAGAIYRISYQE